MATNLVAQIQASVNWTLSTTPAGYSAAIPATNQFSYDSATLSNGVGVGLVNLIYASQLTIAASGNSVINLNNTPTTDPFGNNIVMARAKYVYINLTTLTTASNITVGNATHPLGLFSAGTATININNGGIFVYGDAGATGIAITTNLTDQLKILNADASNVATVNTCVLGANA